MRYGFRPRVGTLKQVALTCGRRQMFADCRGFSEQTIERDQGRDCGKQGEQPVKDHAGCYRQEAVFSDALVGPPQDVFPAPPRNLPRRGGMPAPARLERAPMLRGPWLFRTCRARARLSVAAAQQHAAIVRKTPAVARPPKTGPNSTAAHA
jgi:hypothetical protein